MPTGYRDWRDYADPFPKAYRTVEQAVAYLRNARHVTRVYLLGHSMGARMASAYVSQNPTGGISGFIVAGCRNNGGQPLSCKQNLDRVTLPVLDIWGGKNRKDARAAAERRGMVSDTYTQIEIPAANHKFQGREDELVDAVADWLKSRN